MLGKGACSPSERERQTGNAKEKTAYDKVAFSICQATPFLFGGAFKRKVEKCRDTR
jgi:hypothetical protein